MQVTAQVPSPMSISQVVRRATIRLLLDERAECGLGPVGEGLDEGVDELLVEAAMAAKGAPMLEAALVAQRATVLGDTCSRAAWLAVTKAGRQA
jgi:hypothetical protein